MGASCHSGSIRGDGTRRGDATEDAATRRDGTGAGETHVRESHDHGVAREASSRTSTTAAVPRPSQRRRAAAAMTEGPRQANYAATRYSYRNVKASQGSGGTQASERAINHLNCHIQTNKLGVPGDRLSQRHRTPPHSRPVASVACDLRRRLGRRVGGVVRCATQSRERFAAVRRAFKSRAVRDNALTVACTVDAARSQAPGGGRASVCAS